MRSPAGAAGHHPAGAARHHVQLGPLVCHAEHPGHRAGRRGYLQYRGVPAPGRPDGVHRAVLHPHRRADDGRGVRLVRAGHGGISLESLRQSGWARLNLPPADQYAPHAEGNFPTPSGKVEFRSSIAEQAGNFVLPLFRQGSDEYQPGGTVDPLPHYVPPRETADMEYRLNLISPKSHAYLSSSAGDQPAQRRVQGEQAVTVHPHDAAERGITDGKYVRVFNDRGQFVALARVTDEIAPGVVMAPMGAWPWVAAMAGTRGYGRCHAVWTRQSLRGWRRWLLVPPGTAGRLQAARTAGSAERHPT